jgi:hypothetical protein
MSEYVYKVFSKIFCLENNKDCQQFKILRKEEITNLHESKLKRIKCGERKLSLCFGIFCLPI